VRALCIVETQQDDDPVLQHFFSSCSSSGMCSIVYPPAPAWLLRNLMTIPLSCVM
jgi:hypothetical protein